MTLEVNGSEYEDSLIYLIVELDKYIGKWKTSIGMEETSPSVWIWVDLKVNG